jgi:hypothetical protein
VNQAIPITPTPLSTLVRDAAARMALWGSVLPGWCDQDDPTAKALQVALGIRLALEEIDKEDELVRMTLRPVDDSFLRNIEDTKRRFRYRPRLIIGYDDIDAARLVVTRAVTVLTLADIRKERWRATIGDDFLNDWTIIKRVLVQHQSIRDLARELGLDHSGLSGRFRDAIKAIAKALGPVEWPISLSPHQNPYSRCVFNRTRPRPQWHHKLHVHVDRPGFQKKGEQALAAELELAARFVANGGSVQKLPPGLAVDYFKGDDNISGQHCVCYGPDEKIFWTISRRPQPAWDNVPGGARYPDTDLFSEPRWEGKQHAAFERKWQRGLQWLDPWQSKPTQRFAVKFYNAGENGLLPGRKNRGGKRDCSGPAWEMWTIGSQRSSSSGVEPGEVRNDTRDLMARWVPPPSYLNLTPEEMNSLFFE